MADPVEAVTSFAYDQDGAARVIKRGQVVAGDSDVAQRHPRQFRPAFEDTTRAPRTLGDRSQRARQAARAAAEQRAAADADGGEAEERVENAADAESQLEDLGGGWFRLPDGRKVRGRDEALEALEALRA